MAQPLRPLRSLRFLLFFRANAPGFDKSNELLTRDLAGGLQGCGWGRDRGRLLLGAAFSGDQDADAVQQFLAGVHAPLGS